MSKLSYCSVSHTTSYSSSSDHASPAKVEAGLRKGAGVSLACRETTSNRCPAERQHQCIDRSTHPSLTATIVLLAHIIYIVNCPRSLSFTHHPTQVPPPPLNNHSLHCFYSTHRSRMSYQYDFTPAQPSRISVELQNHGRDDPAHLAAHPALCLNWANAQFPTQPLTACHQIMLSQQKLRLDCQNLLWQ